MFNGNIILTLMFALLVGIFLFGVVWFVYSIKRINWVYNNRMRYLDQVYEYIKYRKSNHECSHSINWGVMFNMYLGAMYSDDKMLDMWWCWDVGKMVNDEGLYREVVNHEVNREVNSEHT